MRCTHFVTGAIPTLNRRRPHGPKRQGSYARRTQGWPYRSHLRSESRIEKQSLPSRNTINWEVAHG